MTQRSSIVCWDRATGEPLTPVISWQDTRGSNILEQVSLSLNDVRHRTGLFANSHFGASKIAWCLRHSTAVQKASREKRLCIGSISSFLLHHLAAERPFSIDPCNAQRTLLYNISGRCWDAGLLDQFGLSVDSLPEVKPHISDWGTLSVASRPIPIRLVSGDQNTAFVALGANHQSTAVVNVGTGAFIGIPVANPADVPDRLLKTVLPGAGQQQFIAEGTVNGAGRALNTVAQQLGCDIEAMRPLQNKELIFLNGEGGLAAPYWQGGFQSRFIGEGDPGHKLMAVRESIGFLLRCCLMEFGQQENQVDCLKVAGGVSRSDTFCQQLADLFQRPVLRPSMSEATAMGAAMLLAESPSWETTEDRFVPNQDKCLHKRFQHWLDAMEASKGLL
ncbi:hypothetical protein KFE80_02135 [bacterium SCSIO 12696]|nr:hypothetical protein KFE80_02135 [bacterium SCSIO 12696]